jgi:hypothetical protein
VTAHGATHGSAHRATHLLLHLGLHLARHLLLHLLAGTLAHRTLAHLALAHLALTHGALTHGALTHLALTHGALAHRTLTHGALALLAALGTGARGQLRRTARQLGRATHGATHLLLRRARYAGGYGGAGTSHALRRALLLVLLLGRLAHALLLVLRSRARGRRQFGAQVLVLAEQASQFGFDLVEEGIDLVLVIAFSEADGRELLVPHVLGGQRHLFTST